LDQGWREALGKVAVDRRGVRVFLVFWIGERRRRMFAVLFVELVRVGVVQRRSA
jgi:hypothetical protein